MNVFQFFCYGPFEYSTSYHTLWHRIGPPRPLGSGGGDGSGTALTANRHYPWNGVAKIIECPNRAAKPHVRKIPFKLDSRYPAVLDSFPNQWWQTVERDILVIFPHLEQMTVQISPRVLPELTFCMVFQRRKLTTERRQDYGSILAASASHDNSRSKTREALLTAQYICDAVAASQTKWEMIDCTFVVKTISLTDKKPAARFINMNGTCLQRH